MENSFDPIAQQELLKLQNEILKIQENLTKKVEKKFQYTEGYDQKLGYFQDLENKLMNFSTIQMLIDQILKLSDFSQYSECIFMVHEKGTDYIIKYSMLNGQNRVIRENLPAFNKLFDHIKKSKGANYSFGRDAKLNIDLSGTFLSTAYQFLNHRVLFIISKNEFLPPDIKDIENFEIFSNVLENFLKIVLNFESSNKKYKDVVNILYHFPLKIRVYDPDNNIWFQNLAAIEQDQYDKKNLLKVLHHNRGFKSEVYSEENKSNSDFEYYHQQRISLLGELLNTLQHELNNPLFGLNLSSALLAESEELNDNKDFLENIQECTIRCQNILEDFSNLYHHRDQQRTVQVSKIIQEAITLSKSETKGILINISYQDITKSTQLKTHPTWLVQIIFNLIINAAQAISNAKVLKPEINIKIMIEKSKLVFKIDDNGPGIHELDQELIFKPFFTTKDKGTGLGLAISQNLIKKLSGTLLLKNKKKGGVRCLVSIPFDS